MKKVIGLVCICSLLGLFAGCFKSKKSALEEGKIKISKADMAFSVEELKTEPGEAISFDLFNGLSEEKLRFYLLKDGEDPILVQHIKAQQGGVPKDYYIFESKDIEPNTELKVSFTAPGEEGTYAFVGVGETPRETMVGRLIVKKKKEVALEGADKGIN